MKFIRCALLCLLFFFSSYSLFALQIGCHDIFIECGGEWLYFTPIVDSTPIQDAPGTGAATFIGIESQDLKYHSGWRAEAAALFCDKTNKLNFRWTQLKASETFQTLTSRGFIPSNLGADPIDHKFFSFHSFEALLAHNFCNDSCFSLELFGGIHYAWIRSKELFSLPALLDSPVGKREAKFHGLGGELGVEISYQLICSFALKGRCSSSLLVGKESGFDRSLGINTNQKIIKSTAKIIPVFDLRFGIEYTYCLRCLEFEVEAGYEFLTYQGALPFSNNQTASSEFVVGCTNASMHGPYISLHVIF